ncbi:MAG: MFS transporter, partial [Actinobacteria bacterium]|nr:MFS transporter [Actinomycetota bacterium]
LGLLGTVRSYELLLVTAFLTGLTLDTFRPASQALMVDIVGIERRQQAFGLNFWAVNLGFALAGVLGSALVSHGFWLLFLVDALSGVAFAAIVWFGIPADPPRARTSVPEPTGRPAGLLTALRDPIILGLAVTLVIEGLVYQQSLYVYPLAMIEDGMEASDYGAIAFCNGIVIVLLQPWWTRVVDRYSPMPTMAAGMVVLGVGFFLTIWADTKDEYVLVCIVWTCGEILRAGLVGAVVANISPASARARYQSAVMGLGYGTASLLAPLVGTRVFSAFGGDAVWVMCLVLNLAGALWLITSMQRKYQQRLQSLTHDVQNVPPVAPAKPLTAPHDGAAEPAGDRAERGGP